MAIQHRFHTPIRGPLRGSLVLLAGLVLLLGARCGEAGETTAQAVDTATPAEAPAGEVRSDRPMGETTVPRDVVVYFMPNLDVRVEGSSFVVRPSAGPEAPAELSKQAAKLNQRVAASAPLDVSPVFSPAVGEAPEDLPPAFTIALPEETSEADAEALAADLAESPLVEEAYVSQEGEEPGGAEAGP